MCKALDQIPAIEKDVVLAPYTSFHIGGKARHFFIARSKEEAIKAVKLARKHKVKYFILSGGSNVLISDKGFNGLVVKMENREWKVKKRNLKKRRWNITNKRVWAESGVVLSYLVSQTVNEGLQGLEWAMGIPGRIGGNIYENVNAFRYSIGDIVHRVKIFDGQEERWVSQKECQFGYKQSIFKNHPKWLILGAELNLSIAKKKKLKELMIKYIEKRADHIPKGKSAGSVFTNVETGGLPILEKGKEIGIEVPEPYLEWKRIPAGWLLEQFGFKGKKYREAYVSEKHANFIINKENAKARDVQNLINLMKKKVKKELGIELKEEIELVGFEK